MASTAAAYRNSDDSHSAKTRQLSPFRLKELVRYSGAPRHLRDTILAALRASDGAGVVLWPAVKGMMLEAGVCRRTVQRNRKRLCDLGIWTITRQPNSWDSGRTNFRRSATYTLNIEKLRKLRRPKEIESSEWRSYREYKASNNRRPQHASQHEARPKPAPVAPIAHRGTVLGSRKFERIHDKRIALTAKIGDLMRGKTRHTEPQGGYGFDLTPDDPRYQAPLSKENAFSEACKALCLTLDEGRELLKFSAQEGST